MATLALSCVVAMLCACERSATDSNDPCTAVGQKLVELAQRNKHAAMVAMLPTVRRAMVAECRADKWTEATRACVLSATSAAQALHSCPITWSQQRPPTTPTTTTTTTTTTTPEPCTNAARGGHHIKCLRSVESGHRPKAVQFSPDGKELWVALHYDRPAVEVFDTTTWALVGAVDLGVYGAVELAFSPDGKRVYASQYETASVFEIDRGSRMVMRQLKTGSKASKVITVTPDGTRVFVANWSGRDITEFSAKTGKRLRTLPVAGIPRGMFITSDHKSLYVTSFSPGKLFKIDLATGSIKTVYDKGKAIRHIVGDRNTGTLYVSDLGSSNIYKVDLQTDHVSVLATANHKTNTIALSGDGKVLFASNRGANNPQSFLLVGPEWGSIQAFDTTTGELLDTVVAGNQTTGLSISPNGTLLAVSDFLDNRINIYTLPSTTTLLNGGGPKHRLLKRGFTGKEQRTPHNPSHWEKLSKAIPRWSKVSGAVETSHQ